MLGWQSNTLVPGSTRSQRLETAASNRSDSHPDGRERISATPQRTLPASGRVGQPQTKPAPKPVKRKVAAPITSSAPKKTRGQKRRVDQEDEASSDEEGELFFCPFSRPRQGFHCCTALGEGRKSKKAVYTFSRLSKTRFGDICVKFVSMRRVEKSSLITTT